MALHGKTHGLHNTRIYHTWEGMKGRCYVKSTRNYSSYGGRGIKVCGEWLKFEGFYKWAIKNGYQDDLTIDRIDNDKDYSPDNCRFISKSKNRPHTYDKACKQGHPWTKESTFYKKELRVTGERSKYCRICKSIRNKKWREGK